MGSEIEITETPNWLKELEAKRERRLKTKLGHELGAGAPCLTCEEKCPGLDLHFWRKICKNCKCSKENHEVQDDDIYGWAQDELLGTKVNRLKRKIVLPGRKDKEVELEWAPTGQKETIDKYLKTVPPELLPIKGSQAAQDRKQMLKKQIPIHDIDPTLCHELTDEELRKMQEYVAHVKQSSVGVGHLIQINFGKGQTHVMDKNDAMFLINNVPKGVVSSENVILHGGDNSKNLTNKLGGLNFNDVIRRNNLNRDVLVVTEDVQVPQETCLRDVSYSYDDHPGLQNLVPSAFVPTKFSSDCFDENDPRKELDVGIVRELPYPSQFVNDRLKYQNLPYYNSGNVHVVEENQNQAYFKPIKDLAYPTTQNEPQTSYDVNSAFATSPNHNSVRLHQPKAQIDNLSHFSPAKPENRQELAQMRNLKDLAHSTYDSPREEDFHNLSVKDRLNELKRKELSVLGPRNSPVSDRTLSPSKFTVKDRVMNLTPSFTNRGYQNPDQSPNLQGYGASSSKIPQEEDLEPEYIPIGAIRDIEYPGNIRTALSKDNELFEGSTPNKIEPDLHSGNLPSCHYCKGAFEQEELAIAIPERSNAIYHTGCFKCHGCNQILADMFYFYDKETDEVYCGRDYAKIRGIPRCMACDELIFVKEYCLAENSTFHVKHFCCFECDKPLADQNYVMENNQPVCIPCYDSTKANKCYACEEVIHPDQQGLQLKDGVHFHATEDCFACKVCEKSLFGAKLLFRNDRLYCSHDCFNSDA